MIRPPSFRCFKAGVLLEKIRISGSETIRDSDVRQALRQWLTGEPKSRPTVLSGLHGGNDFELTAFPLNSDEHIGVVVAGSNRCNFPTKSERLILSVTANQATSGLREAQILAGQHKTVRELDSAQRNEAIETDGLKDLHTPQGVQLARLAENYARLTRRERQVLPFVVAGRLSKQIAAELGTSDVTIRVHSGQIMRKMRAQSLAELIRMTDRLGIH
ncbi:MAG TPA: LuxR C-terminal-related transcriptional regulator [Bryobacteraceae bacterium]|nr:LuxR C-terminal-related transcriptional regulator [Bryobacteraceae bacterium]